MKKKLVRIKDTKKTKPIKREASTSNLAKFTVGFQYEFFPLFLDRQGMFVEKCRKLFIPGTPLNISPELPAGITILANDPSVEIKFLPFKTVISQKQIFPRATFDKLLMLFHTNLRDFYKDCKLQYIGAVIEKENILGTNKISLKLPNVDRKYRYNFRGVVKNDERGIYDIALDTQKVVDITFDDIVSILSIASGNFDRFMKQLR